MMLTKNCLVCVSNKFGISNYSSFLNRLVLGCGPSGLLIFLLSCLKLSPKFLFAFVSTQRWRHSVTPSRAMMVNWWTTRKLNTFLVISILRPFPPLPCAIETWSTTSSPSGDSIEMLLLLHQKSIFSSLWLNLFIPSLASLASHNKSPANAESMSETTEIHSHYTLSPSSLTPPGLLLPLNCHWRSIELCTLEPRQFSSHITQDGWPGGESVKGREGVGGVS